MSKFKIIPFSKEFANRIRHSRKDDFNKANFPLSLIGYNAKQEMVFTKLVGDADIDELIARTFDEHPNVEFLHACNAEACCYICKIEWA